MHIWLQLYGVNETGRTIIDEVDGLMASRELRFGFGIETEAPSPPPGNLLLGQHLIAGIGGVTSSSTPGTHVLMFGFDSTCAEPAITTGIRLGAAMRLGDVVMELTLQDHHVSRNRTSQEMSGTKVLFWELWVRAAANGTPRIELPARSSTH